MKSYLLLIHLFYSLPSIASDSSEHIPLLSTSGSISQSLLSDEAESNNPDEGLRQGGRASRPISIPEQRQNSPKLEDYIGPPPKTVLRVEVPRRTLFEPHMRRIEEGFIRQLTFKIRVRKHTTEERCIKIIIEGFLRDKRMMKQTVDIEY